MNTKKEEVLRQLKLARKTKGISYQDIVEGTERMGVAVSLSSVKRVFADGSCAEDFRYDTTLRPIVRFVLGIDSDAEEPETLEDAQVTAAGLVAVVDYKDTMIDKLEGELARVRDDCQRQKDYLKKELELARQEKAAAERTLRNYRATTIVFLILFALLLLVVIAYLIVDRSSPSWGIFWRDAVAAFEHSASNLGGYTAKVV